MKNIFLSEQDKLSRLGYIPFPIFSCHKVLERKESKKDKDRVFVGLILIYTVDLLRDAMYVCAYEYL